MNKKYKLGVIGAGNMGMAIAGGAVENGLYTAQDILLFNRTEEKRAQKRAMGFAVTEHYQEVYTECKMVVLGVKPQNFTEILTELSKENLAEKPVIISIAAGITMDTIERYLGKDCAVIRVMPNTPLQLSLGACAFVKNNAATSAQLDCVLTIFNKLGATAVFEKEDQLNDVIPYNGSGPAYVYYFIEAMAKSAEEHGFDRATILPLICKTFIGSAEMVLRSGKTPEELIRAVCSPGGTTIEAIRVLEDRDITGTIAEASDKCIKRAYELGKS